jgi:methylmalonyl-CoA/ethylmalonyl-CoA epimerase
MKLMQIGFVLKDLDRTVSYMKQYFGLEPYSCGPWPPEGRDDIKRFYQGEPSGFTLKIAFFDLGNIELEMIQPQEGQNVYTDFIAEKGEGIHHIRFNTQDGDPLVANLLDKGTPVIQWGTGLNPGTRWVYFDTSATLGFLTEVLETIPNFNGMPPASSQSM